jgi:hypothetical protein
MRRQLNTTERVIFYKLKRKLNIIIVDFIEFSRAKNHSKLLPRGHILYS